MFGANSPTGQISGSKLSDGSIGATKLGVGVSLANIQDGSLAATKFASSAALENLVDGSVPGAKLADQSVSISKLALKPSGTTVGAGGIAISQSTGLLSSNGIPLNTTIMVSTNLTVMLTTTGRPMFIGLVSSDPNAHIRVLGHGNDANGVLLKVAYKDNGSEIGWLNAGFTLPNSGGATFFVPTGSFSHIYLAPAGQRTITAEFAIERFNGPSSNNGLELHHIRLIAFEL